MDKHEKILSRVLRGGADANIDFADLCNLLKRLGFDERTRGSHRVFRKAGVPVMINLQSESGKAKPYQVRQVRKVITENRLGGEGPNG